MTTREGVRGYVDLQKCKDQNLDWKHVKTKTLPITITRQWQQERLRQLAEVQTSKFKLKTCKEGKDIDNNNYKTMTTREGVRGYVDLQKSKDQNSNWKPVKTKTLIITITTRWKHEGVRGYVDLQKCKDQSTVGNSRLPPCHLANYWSLGQTMSQD